MVMAVEAASDCASTEPKPNERARLHVVGDGAEAVEDGLGQGARQVGQGGTGVEDGGQGGGAARDGDPPAAADAGGERGHGHGQHGVVARGGLQDGQGAQGADELVGVEAAEEDGALGRAAVVEPERVGLALDQALGGELVDDVGVLVEGGLVGGEADAQDAGAAVGGVGEAHLQRADGDAGDGEVVSDVVALGAAAVQVGDGEAAAVDQLVGGAAVGVEGAAARVAVVASLLPVSSTMDMRWPGVPTSTST
ncbi:hypothetical protein VTK73DRAFT_6331 [Phialemonium thermophilum]|uniref:Uncharacterized protein n=1 Tax=Phialemonium thermophilum TaxID=223376 RepID=A0ABR3V0A4_9PEZI